MHQELVSDRKKPKLRRNNAAEVLVKEHKQYKTKIQAVISLGEEWK